MRFGSVAIVSAPWQRLYFLPLPQGQGSLRPTVILESRQGATRFAACTWRPCPDHDQAERYYARGRGGSVEVIARLTVARRLELAFEISEMARALARARLREEHADWDDADLDRELLRLAFAPDDLPPGL